VLVLTLHSQASDAGAVGAALLSRLRMAAFSLRISLDALAEEAGQGESARRAFHSYYSLLHRIDQLSDTSSLARGELLCRVRPVELCALVRELTDSVSVFAAGRQVSVTCDVPEGECFADGDRERLEQMLLILLSNALLHTSPGGQVTLTLRRDGDRYILSVDDNGEGMSAEELAYAFSLRESPPLTAAASGAGMGLYIVQGIARLHGGTAMLHSVPGRGTRVRITIPAKDSCCVFDAAPASGRPELILTELSGVLPDEAYDRKYMD
jgi:signal transduction histidine kinase